MYLDGGANNHVTDDLENLTMQQPYKKNYKLPRTF
jgi:hypothetical protein